MPLLERAKFLAIYSQNLDEFFQVRVAGLKDQVAASITATSPTGAPQPSSCSTSATRSTCSTCGRWAIFTDSIVPGLRETIAFSRWTSSTTTTASTSTRCSRSVLPGATPLGG